MKIARALLLVLPLLAAGCATPQEAPRPVAALPPPAAEPIAQHRTTTPALRTDGDAPQRHKRIVAAASKGGYEIVFLGASIVERWESVGRERWDAVWLPRHAINCGIGGDRTQHVLWRLDDGLLEALANDRNSIRWIVLNIGSNNTDVDSAKEIAAGTEAILSKLHTRLPNARVVLTMLPRERNSNVPIRRRMLELLNILTLDLAQPEWSWVTVLDLWPQMLAGDGSTIPPELMPDAVHPSAAGYVIWSKELERVMR
ncbi:MAG: GDSL-type esterase/lipase family protein [Phycisphaerales bacterium]